LSKQFFFLQDVFVLSRCFTKLLHPLFIEAIIISADFGSFAFTFNFFTFFLCLMMRL